MDLRSQSAQRRAEMLAEHKVLDGEVPMPEADLQGILERMRDLGYWQGDSQQAFGATDISTPILGPRGDALAVLTCPFISETPAQGATSPCPAQAGHARWFASRLKHECLGFGHRCPLRWAWDAPVTASRRKRPSRDLATFCPDCLAEGAQDIRG